MIRGWLSSCGIRSIDVRGYGYVPHTRLFKPQSVMGLKKDTALEILKDQGYAHCFELQGNNNLRTVTVDFFSQIDELSQVCQPWSCFKVDQKKMPTVLFAFKSGTDAVRAKLILETERVARGR
jgi:hypothetical protein